MTEFRRLLLTARSQKARMLLEAGGSESPPEEALARVGAALGLPQTLLVAQIAVSSASSTAVATHSAVKSVGSMALKWLAVGALTGGLASTTLALRREPATQPTARMVSTRERQKQALVLPVLVAPSGNPVIEVASEHAPAQPASVLPMPPASASARSQLEAEVIQIDAARDALKAGDVRAAMALLDQYQAHERTGTLDREATILRIDALVRLSRRAEAETSARAFLREFPHDPHASKLNQLLTGND